MITLILKGGLGNQMFQYATARALAIKNKDVLRIDTSALYEKGDTPRVAGLQFFNIEADFVNLPHPNIFQVLYNKILFKFNNYYSDFAPNVLKEKTTNKNFIIHGYFQSEKNFSDARGYLLKDFSLKNLISDGAKVWEENIKSSNQKNKAISILVRHGDFLTNPKMNKYHGTLDISYYEKAISYITERFPDAKFFIFSDDQKWVEDNFKKYGSSVEIVPESVPYYESLYLMSLCSHNIIANSSFSWWGAWLNQNHDKIVIAPKNWLADPNKEKKLHPNIIPETWIRM